jgi:hypothetical protein
MKMNQTKKSLVASSVGLLVAAVCGQAFAACDNASRLNAAQIGALLAGNTVCVPAINTVPMTWQELHSGGATGGTLIDFKRGVGHATDPSETVGTWTVNGTGVGNSTVTHNYGTGGSYTYTVHGTGAVNSNHSFCAGATEIVGRVKSGGGAC